MVDNIEIDPLMEITADIVSAHVSNNILSSEELPALIRSVHAALAGLGEEAKAPEPDPQQPAISIRSSVKPDFIVCLEDGKKLKMLKRYLWTNYKMTPDDYRAKWKLPSDYPMVAPNYAEQRSALAKSIGLGRKRAPEPVVPPKAPARRGRKPKAEVPA